jgi:hypothetical protein
MITIFGLVPLTVLPDFVTEFVTSIAVYAGTVTGGGGLLPPLVLHLPPHEVAPDGTFAKPLKLLGAVPPLMWFSFDQLLLQNVIVPVPPASRSPITKLPPTV